MTDGWIYCFKNASMKDIYKVGMTTRHPSQRLMEANQADTWRPPAPYVAVLTRKVTNVRDKESTIHDILSDLGYRLHPQREFFNASLSLIEKLFSLTDGEWGCTVDTTIGDNKDVIEHEVGDNSTLEGTDVIKQHEAKIRDEKVDTIRTFLKYFRETNPTVHKIQAAELYSHYCSWCDDTDIMLETQNTFGRLLVMEKSCPKIRGRTGFMIYVKQLGSGSLSSGESPDDGDEGDSSIEE